MLTFKLIQLTGVPQKISDQYILVPYSHLIITMHTTYSNVNVIITDRKVSSVDRSAVYTIRIQTREANYYLEKKYPDIVNLHSLLKTHHANMPALPQKSLLSFFVANNQDDTQQIQQYLRQLTIRPDILNSDYTRDFFSLDKNSPKVLCNTPKLLGNFSIVTGSSVTTTSTRGVRQFYYDTETHTIILITGDMNAISRVNSYITNTKMPWQKQQEAPTLIAVGTVECWARLRENYGYDKIWTKIYPSQATTLYYNKARERLLIGLDDGTVDELKVSSRNKFVKYQQSATLKIHNDRITGFYYDAVSAAMYSISHDCALVTCDMSSYIRVHVSTHMQSLECMLTDQTNKRLFIGADEGHIFVYEYSKKIPVALFSILTAQNGPIKALSIDLVKNYLFAVGFNEGGVMVFDIDKPGRQKFTKQIACLEGKEGPRQLVWVASKMEILVGDKQGAITFWDSIKGEQIYVLRVDGEEITQMWYDDSSKLLITATKGRFMKFWQLPSFWRDAKLIHTQQEEIEVRRKVDNALKIKNNAKKAAEDSDQDDLAYWHMDTSSDESDDST